LFVMITVAYQLTGAARVPFTGDEPHNLMATISLLRDGDFDLENNYAAQQYREFWPDVLLPQNPIGPGGENYRGPAHGIGFPILLALPFRFLGAKYISWFLLAVAGIGALLLAAYADREFGPGTGTIAGLMLMTLPVWQVYGGHVFTETTGGTIAMAAFFLLSANRPSRWALVVSGVLLAYLPFLYLRYLTIAAALAMLGWGKGHRWLSPWLFGPAALVLAGETALTVHVYGQYLRAISPNASRMTFLGAGERFWRLFFDRAQGIAPEQPVLILGFWAAPFLLREAYRRKRGWAPAIAVLALGLYAVPFALYNSSSGECAPGRFFCAACPLILVTVLHWAKQGDSLDFARRKMALALWAVSLAIIVEGIAVRTPPWLAMLTYQRWFPFGWGPASFMRTDPYVQGECLTYGVLLVVLVWLSKSVTAEWHKVTMSAARGGSAADAAAVGVRRMPRKR
jgi:hypothetical protein